jgi:FAD/FMN-containing dehydrogenase
MPTLDVQGFRSAFHGQAFEAADAGYDDARRIWNASVDKHPRVIARCAGLADVMAAVNFARSNDLVTAIRGGGHNVGGRALCDDGMVIDLSRMSAVYVDCIKRTVRVQGGATLGDMDRETHIFGLAVPCGIVSKTGIGGLTLGGGVGWLIRKYGMTIDNLLSVSWSQPKIAFSQPALRSTRIFFGRCAEAVVTSASLHPSSFERTRSTASLAVSLSTLVRQQSMLFGISATLWNQLPTKLRLTPRCFTVQMAVLSLA